MIVTKALITDRWIKINQPMKKIGLQEEVF